MNNKNSNTTVNNSKTTPTKRKNPKKKFKLTKQWAAIYVPIIVISILFLVSVITICVMPSVEYQLLANIKKNTKSGLPNKLLAPFVDMSSWIDLSSSYSINGAPNLGKFASDTGILYYNLGFINPLTNKPTNADGSINWGWGGYSDLTKSSTSSQYLGIVQSIENLKNQGGKYIVSIGGQAGDSPWTVSQNVESLKNFYLDVIDTYNITRLDLDIEENNQDYENNKTNAKAIKQVQDQTDIEVVLTIPIMPSGWQQKQINLINAYLSEGVELSLINSMCMCYGSGVSSTEDYGDASLRAIENSIKQLQTIYSSYGIDLSETMAYMKTGCTVAIGYEGTYYPTFTTSMMQKVTNHASSKNYGMLSFWSMGRDSTIDSNKGISSKYQFTNIALEYLK